jgi:hypothetical protein
MNPNDPNVQQVQLVAKALSSRHFTTVAKGIT